MTVDLCIVNFNTGPLLRRLLKTLMVNGSLLSEHYNLFVSDNASHDGSIDMLRNMLEDVQNSVTIIENKNIGYARACNQLAAMGSGEIIGLLNADVWFTEQDILTIEKRFLNTPEVAVLGPKQRNERGLIVHAGITGEERSPKHRGWMSGDPQDVRYKDFAEMVTVSGSAYFIRRSVWEDLTNCPTYQRIAPNAEGAFLPTPHYFEETWCSYHARKHGYRVFYDGSISIGHTWHASSSVGSAVDANFPASKEIFVAACKAHKIPHD